MPNLSSFWWVEKPLKPFSMLHHKFSGHNKPETIENCGTNMNVVIPFDPLVGSVFA